MLAYIGNFRPSWSTENYVLRSFMDIGEQVFQLQEDEVTSDQVIEACGRYHPEFVLYTRTWGLKDGREGGHRMLEALARKWIPTATLSLDLYWGINREFMLSQEPMWRTNVVFTADGGRGADFKTAGINHVWLPPAVYGHDCFRGTPREEYRKDVVFVGSYRAYHKEWPFRQHLVEVLRQEYGDRFELWGDAKYIRGWDLNDLFASVKVVVGDSLARPFYWSDRVPETLGRGGFLLSPKVEGMENEGFLERGTIAYYQSGDTTDCLARLANVLRPEYPRNEISEQGMNLVRSKHTYADRCRTIVDTVRRYREGWTGAAAHLG